MSPGVCANPEGRGGQIWMMRHTVLVQFPLKVHRHPLRQRMNCVKGKCSSSFNIHISNSSFSVTGKKDSGQGVGQGEPWQRGTMAVRKNTKQVLAWALALHSEHVIFPKQIICRIYLLSVKT